MNRLNELEHCQQNYIWNTPLLLLLELPRIIISSHNTECIRHCVRIHAYQPLIPQNSLCKGKPDI